MENLIAVATAILTAANLEIGEKLLERAAVVNSCFDDAYGSCLGGHYASGLECAAEGLRNLDDLLEYADKVAPTATGSEWEFVRDALGSVVMSKAPIEKSIRQDYELKISRFVNPGFNCARQVISVDNHGVKCVRNDFADFRYLVDKGILDSALMYCMGACYYYDTTLGRWVFDALINPAVRPDLEKYMK